MARAAILIIAFLSGQPFFSIARAEEVKRPNILYFYVDDMGWGSIGPNGQADRRAQGLPYVRTPNLDALARSGVNFTRGYGCTVCSPARSSQQSGFHQGHTFADRNDPDNAKKAMRSDDTLIGDALSAAGYATGYWGKWGYGGSKDQERPVIQNVQTLPTSHGYQHVLAELHHVRAHTFFQPTLWRAPAKPGALGGLELVANSMAGYAANGSYPETPALQNDPRYPAIGYCDDAYAYAALDFVRREANNYNESGKPFFGLLAVQIPHAPFGEISTLPEWDKQYANDSKFASLADQTRQWAAMVTRIDAHFGNILAALEDPNNDGDNSDTVAANTLVVFQSDNGGPKGSNNLQLNANGGLRGNKGGIYEGGIRVPLVMRWPKKINRRSTLRAGSNSDRVVDVTDLLPTFCELARTPAPHGIDGVSIAPLLLGEGVQRNREFIIHEAGNSASIIRGNFKLVRHRRGRAELYDLAKDHSEATDVSAAHPDLVEELQRLLIAERVDEPRGFANTYHHWTGADGASLSDESNWSEYRYESAGKTYMLDDGAPKLSWTARLLNMGVEECFARGSDDLRLLSLELQGSSEDAVQGVVLEESSNLEARNGVRIGEHSVLKLNGGRIQSMRWVDILTGGTLTGFGQVHCDVYNDGRVAFETGESTLSIEGDYRQSTDSSMRIAVGSKSPSIAVNGTANLSGDLLVSLPNGQRANSGDSYVFLTAKKINGRFERLVLDTDAADAQDVQVLYGKSTVSIRFK